MKKSLLYGIFAGLAGIIGFVYGIYLGQSLIGAMWFTWGGTALLVLSFLAIKFHLDNQCEIIKAINPDYKEKLLFKSAEGSDPFNYQK